MSIKVTMMGAGSLVFTQRLLVDILTVPELQDTHFAMMDIDPSRLEMAVNLAKKVIADHKLPAQVTGTTNRREALEGAQYVMVMVQVGGLEMMAHDINIPLKYGVKQCVGDTLGPGGVFRALRTIPVMLEMAADMRAVCPDTLVLNHTNPLAMICRALNAAGGVETVGLCHAVQGNIKLIARMCDVPVEEINFQAGGINHMTWFLRVRHNGQDLTPRFLEAMERHPEYSKNEKCRIDMCRRFGHWVTESNGHLSEYLPWYRSSEAALAEYCNGPGFVGETGAYLRICLEYKDEFVKQYQRIMAETEPIKLERSHEFASRIIESQETGRPFCGYFNLANHGLIDNLTAGAVVEAPCWVNRNGIQAVHVGKLPPQCAAACESNIRVQELTVQAALEHNRLLVYHAVLQDPLTSAVCTTKQVWAMVDELFEAEKALLPGW